MLLSCWCYLVQARVLDSAHIERRFFGAAERVAFERHMGAASCALFHRAGSVHSDIAQSRTPATSYWARGNADKDAGTRVVLTLVLWVVGLALYGA